MTAFSFQCLFLNPKFFFVCFSKFYRVIKSYFYKLFCSVRYVLSFYLATQRKLVFL